MGQWISSKEFAEKFNLNRDTIIKSTSRADKKGKNFCSIRFNILYFKYSEGVGGYAGKVLQIWDTPLSQKQVEALEKGYPVKYVLEEMGEMRASKTQESAGLWIASATPRNDGEAGNNDKKTTQPNVVESTKDSKALDCNKGSKNEKISKENSRKTLHARGIPFL